MEWEETWGLTDVPKALVAALGQRQGAPATVRSWERNDAPEVVVSYPGAPSSQQSGRLQLGDRFDKNLKPPAVSYPMDNADKKRDEVLQRMLKTPPQKHAPREKPNRHAEELIRELDKGTDADLDKIARIVGNKK